MKSYTKRSNISQVVFMAAILLFVIVLMIVINKGHFPVISDPLSQIEGNAGIIKGRYYNKPFRFSVSSPDTNLWNFEYVGQIDSTYIFNTNEQNSKKVVRLNRLENNDTIAVVNVELFERREEANAVKLAALELRHKLKNYRKQNESAAVVGDVTTVNSSSLNGAFYVIELPQSTNIKYPVWVTMFIIRKHMAYKIICQSKRDVYDNIKGEFEYILKNFQLL